MTYTHSEDCDCSSCFILKSAECGTCQWKYSCGYSSIQLHLETNRCPLGLMSSDKPFFLKTKNGLFWHSRLDKLVSEDEARSSQAEYYPFLTKEASNK